MRVLDSYRLELHWESVDKNKDDSCNLTGAYFSGPVLAEAERINTKDSIRIDLTPQYSKILTHHYFVDLFWGNVEYKDGIVILQDVVLKGYLVNIISNLKHGDYILIDTSKHDGDKHLYNLVYRGAVMNKSGEEYA